MLPRYFARCAEAGRASVVWSRHGENGRFRDADRRIVGCCATARSDPGTAGPLRTLHWLRAADLGCGIGFGPTGLYRERHGCRREPATGGAAVLGPILPRRTRRSTALALCDTRRAGSDDRGPFSISVSLLKHVYDEATDLSLYAATWSSSTVGFGGDDFILNRLSRQLDQFLVEYLRVNAEACE